MYVCIYQIYICLYLNMWGKSIAEPGTYHSVLATFNNKTIITIGLLIKKSYSFSAIGNIQETLGQRKRSQIVLCQVDTLGS